MKKILNIILVVLVVILVGCKQADTTPELIEGQEVVVDFPSLIVEPEQQTKSAPMEYVEKRTFGKSGVMTVLSTVNEGITTSPSKTKASVHPAFTNVWVLQFASDGTRLQCNNIGSMAADQTLKATLSVAKGTKIYVLANGPAAGLETKATSEAAFLAATDATPASGVATVWGKAEDIDVVLIDGKAVMMSPGGELRTIGMKPNAAKVNVELDITGMTGMSLVSVGLCNVPETTQFVSGLDKTTSTGYQEDWGEKSAAPYSWDMPQNRQGEVTGITSSSQRNHAKSPKDAAYARVTLELGDVKASFDVFLGSGLTDFNVKSNYIYDLKITIVGTLADFELMAAADDRVNTGSSLDYTTAPANTYITYPTTAGKMYSIKFNATQKPRIKATGAVAHQGYVAAYDSGNSNYYTGGVYGAGAMNGKSLTEDLKASDIDRIEVVWQTMKDHGKGIDKYDGSRNFKDYNAIDEGTAFINKISYNKTTGFATVRINGTGNALVAAYDNQGTILWSWQIWGTETAPQANVNPGNEVNGADKYFMDRNLGAMAATTSRPTAENAYKYFGTMYQWGRKEPFTGVGPQYRTTDGNDVNSIPTAIFDKDGQWMQSDGETANTKPQTNTQGGYTYSNTYASSTYTLLANPTTHYFSSATGSLLVDNPNTWTPYSAGITKSIYDPCPYGYRVPTNGSWTGFPNNKWTAYTVNEGIAWQSSWWPASGYRYNSSALLNSVGFLGWYWSASPYQSTTYAYYLGFNCQGYTTPNSSYGRANGMPVRCVEE